MHFERWIGTSYAVLADEGDVGLLRLSRVVDLKTVAPRLLLEGNVYPFAEAPCLAAPELLRVVGTGNDPTRRLVFEHVPGVSLLEVVTQSRELGGALPVEAAVHVVASVARGVHALAADHFPDPVTSQRVRVAFDGRALLIGTVGVRFDPQDDEFNGPIRVLPPGRLRRGVPPEPALAPEQLDEHLDAETRDAVAERAADLRAEVFRLGALLQLLLDNEHPYADDHPLQSVERLQHDRPRPLVRDVPPALRRLVEDARAPRPADRPADPLALADALAPFCSGHEGQAALAAVACGMFPRLRAQQLHELEELAMADRERLLQDAPTRVVSLADSRGEMRVRPARVARVRVRVRLQLEGGERVVIAENRLVTNAEMLRFIDETGRPLGSFVGDIPELAEEPAVLVTAADAAAYAAWRGGRLPTDAEWSAMVEQHDIPDAARVWEWTSTPARSGFIVRGGPWRNRDGLGHVDHRSWEDEAAPDVGLRVFYDP